MDNRRTTRNFDFLPEELDREPEFLEKDKRKAERRKEDIRKARHKKNVAINSFSNEETERFESEHQYSKNTVHKRTKIERSKKDALSIRDKKMTEMLDIEE